MRTKINSVEACMCCALALGVVPASSVSAAADSAKTAPARTSVPSPQISVNAGAAYPHDGLAVLPAGAGARLRCVFQRLEGEATPEGLWLTSTDDALRSSRFHLVATAVGRTAGKGADHPGSALPRAGRIEVARKLARFIRPGLTEEYCVSVDGVEQSFLLAKRPKSSGELCVTLEVEGARVEPADFGARLVLENSGHQIAYSHLRVTDATGKQLNARMALKADSAMGDREADRSLVPQLPAVSNPIPGGASPSRRYAATIALLVDDADAVYPVRIDPTFSDANWISMNPNIPGADDSIQAALVDGSGNLYIGGSFTLIGDTIANGIAKWDGSRWSTLGSGVDGTVSALALSGSNLYVGGNFTSAGGTPAKAIAKWDGSRWSALGSGMDGPVDVLEVSGSNVYAGGSFRAAGGSPAHCIAKWDGSHWSALGMGIGGGSAATAGPVVGALAVSGSDLYAGGLFTTVTNTGGVSVTANNIAKWDGTSWTALGSGLNGSVGALAVSGNDLYVGGWFTSASGRPANCIAKWDGSHWSALGSGLHSGTTLGWINSMAVAGSSLYVGGNFTSVTNSGEVVVEANYVAKWDGSNWSALGSGVGGASSYVTALAVSGSDVYVGGQFTSAGGITAKNIANWNGSSWTRLGSGSGMNDSVYALAASGSDLYVGGTFTTAGDGPANYIARWDGSKWTALGSGMNDVVFALAVSGQAVYAGGGFTSAGGTVAYRVAKWDGNHWTALGLGMGRTDGLSSSVQMLAASGSDVYAVGSFTTAGGNSAPNGIARWDGTNWTAVGSGMNGTVSVLAVSGSNVYAAGYFSTTGGSPVNSVAKWDGSTWTDLGLGTNAYVNALAAAGSTVYAAGLFTTAGGTAASNVAKWDGNSWSAMGSSVNAYVSGLAVSGTDVYATGGFTTAGASAANYVAKWDGSRWSALGSGVGGTAPYVKAMVVSGNDLYVGGQFTMAGGKVSAYIARAYLSSLPALSVSRCGGEVVVSWPLADTAGFALEQTGALAAPANWVPVSASVSEEGTNKVVTLSATNSPQYFRLRQP